MIAENVPEGKCGFVLTQDEVENENADSMSKEDWQIGRQITCCWRDSNSETGRCILHEDREGKPVQEVKSAVIGPSKNIQGAILQGIESPNEQLFKDANLFNVDFSDSDLSGCDFTNAVIYYTNFSAAKLDSAKFSNCLLKSPTFFEADLRETQFSDEDAPFRDKGMVGGDLRSTNLQNAEIQLRNISNTDFSNSDMRNVDLTDQIFFNCGMVKTNLENANLKDTNLNHGNIRQASLNSADGKRIDLWKADLKGADFERADLTYGNFGHNDFTESDLTYADFSHARLEGSDMSNMDLEDVVFEDADLSRADLSKSHMKYNNLIGSSLRNANLSEAVLYRVRLKNADLEYANLSGADLREANLTGAKLYQTLLTDARINDLTTFDELCSYEQEPFAPYDTPADRFDGAAWVYRRLETLHERNAMSLQAREYHVRKKEAMRKKFKQDGNYGRYAAATANRYLSYHGESLSHVMLASAVVILASGLLYPFIGGVKDGGTVYQTTLMELPTVHGMAALARGLYFSIITFTTIGYANVAPNGPWSRVLVGIESLLGAILVALFVYVLGRRVAR